MNHVLITDENIDDFRSVLPIEPLPSKDRITLGAYNDDMEVTGAISFALIDYQYDIDWLYVVTSARREGVATGLIYRHEYNKEQVIKEINENKHFTGGKIDFDKTLERINIRKQRLENVEKAGMIKIKTLVDGKLDEEGKTKLQELEQLFDDFMIEADNQIYQKDFADCSDLNTDVENSSSIYFIAKKKYELQKKREPPFLRLDYFIIPWLIGFVVTNLFSLYVMSFFSAISALIVQRVLSNRFMYLDYETGAYKQRIFEVPERFANQFKIHSNTAFVLKVPAGEKALIDIIKSNMPDGSAVIRMDKGPFLIFSETRSRLANEVFQKSLQDAGINHDPPVSVFCTYFTRLATETDRRDYIRRIMAQI